MPDVVERVDTLEDLAKQTQLMIQNLSYEVSRTQITVNNLGLEMREFKNEMREFKDEMRQDRKEMKEERKEMNRKWGNLANKWGTIVEDLVYPNIKNIAEKYFGCKKEECEDFILRRMKKGKGRKQKEFDVIAVYPDKVIVNEIKASAKQDYAEQFVNLIKDKTVIYDYFPDFKGKEIIPVFASLEIPENILKYLTKNKIYGMAMKDDTMDILNPNL